MPILGPGAIIWTRKGAGVSPTPPIYKVFPEISPIGIRVIGVGSPVAHLLIGATTTGDGTLVLNDGVCRTKWGVQVVYSGFAGRLVLHVDLYLSLDGSDWWNAGTWSTNFGQTNRDIVTILNQPATAAYLKISAMTGGITPLVDAWVAGV